MTPVQFTSLLATALLLSLETSAMGEEDHKPPNKAEVAPEPEAKIEKPRKVCDAGGKYYLAFSSDSKTLACASQHDVRLFDVETLKHTATFRIDETAPGNTRIRAIAFSPSSDMLVVAEGIWLRIWRTADKKLLRAVKDGGRVNSITFSADGKFATTTNDRSLVNVWSRDFSEKLKSLYVDRLGAYYSPLSPDGNLVYAQGAEEVYLWEHGPGKTLATLSDVQREELASAKHLTLTDISPDGKMLAFSGGRNGILVTDAKSFKTLYREPKREAEKARHLDRFASRTAKFLGKTDRLIVSRGDHYAAVYSITPEIKFELGLAPPSEKEAGISGVTVSPNSKYVASIASIRESDDPFLRDFNDPFERSVWLHRLTDEHVAK
jgi:WD40 repeat protein